MARPKLPITREATPDGFTYCIDGRVIRRAAEIARIESLAIPPAWREVRISRAKSPKIVAQGVDEAGRTQTLYHPKFRHQQDREKFDRMVRFARALPRLRARADCDLQRRRLHRDRVAACVVRLIDQQLFRVGNTEYATAHQSFGVTTLNSDHVEIGSTYVDFDFVGKSGKQHRRRVHDPRVARLLAQLLELPGDAVFQFVDSGDAVHALNSRDVNAYVKRHMGEEFTAKDFRTWGGTVAVVAALTRTPEAELGSAKARATAIRRAILHAAELLGNTPEVTRSSYVDPRVLDLAEHPGPLQAARRQRIRSRRYFDADEQRTLAIIEASTRKH